ncbi:MAG: nicotinate-nucleotide--dimethylbenzimidazole phosphoribosyltransferase [Lachnospiraceae bacterium]|nr:nicotinate-nucleotide--dimethylbenzimidazole phosphoribosyltransferase [Lachnospiraceae bacterium]
MNLQVTIEKIVPPDRAAAEAAWRHWDSLAKPLRSLGKLEKGVVQIAGIRGTPRVRCDRKALLVFCADNGVVEEGISQSGQDVTAIVAENFLDDRTCTAIMARECGADLFPIDIGMAVDTRVNREDKIAYGTKNFAKEPAMTREQAVAAIEAGIRWAEKCHARGYDILATGEMGIGNTTTSSAVTSVLLGVPVETVTGKGAGLSDAGLQKKIRVIRDAVERLRPDPQDALDVLSKVGGLDIAGMAGVFLGGAALHLPVVIDGFISGTAALVAQRLCPLSREYMMASHISGEPAGAMLLEALGMDPWLHCEMRLGEGSGAVAMFPILDMAVKVYYSMATFDETEIETYVPL